MVGNNRREHSWDVQFHSVSVIIDSLIWWSSGVRILAAQFCCPSIAEDKWSDRDYELAGVAGVAASHPFQQRILHIKTCAQSVCGVHLPR